MRHGYAVLRELVLQRASETPHGELAHHVRRPARYGEIAVDASHDREPASALLERFDDRLDGAQHTEDVRLELAAVVVEAEPLHHPGDGDASVGDRDVDATEIAQGLLDRAIDVAFGVDVAADRLAAEILGGLLEAVDAPREKDDACAAARVLVCEEPSDAGGGAGDEDNRSIHGPAQIARFRGGPLPRCGAI